jgi:hypothetical protein
MTRHHEPFGADTIAGQVVPEDASSGEDTDDHAARADRWARRQQAALAVGLGLLAAVLPLIDDLALWPVVAIGAVISGLLLWGALRDESIAGPVVGLVVTASIVMLVTESPAVGALASVVVAIVLGEHLAGAQHTRYATPGNAIATVGAGSALLHGAVAGAAAAMTMLATFLPQARVWSVAALVALGVVAVAVQQRRSAMASQALPPPEQVA